MKNNVSIVRKNLLDAVSQLCEVSWMFCKQPGTHFTRNRKLPFRKVVMFLLAMEGGTLGTQMLRHFGYSVDIPSTSAFVQQRDKLNAETFPSLFSLFVKKSNTRKTYKGLRLIAADGSDFKTPSDPNAPNSYFPGTSTQSAYNLLHLDAMYDLLQHTYMDAALYGKRVANERSALCKMIERSALNDVLLIADRGYEGFNLMAHIQEKGWKFLIRIQDAANSYGIASGLDLPNTEEFDLFVDLSLTKIQTKEVQSLCKNRNLFKRVHSSFDFLPENCKTGTPVFYKLPFRIVRFKITDDSYETVVTNLDSEDFSPEELKRIYGMRWGIETSFRELKYTVGLLHFHAKKVEYIYQEVFARLIMYNFTELVTSHVIIQKFNAKYAYKANFSVAVHVCRQFFLGNVSPPDVEATISRNVSVIRTGRSNPRNIVVKHAISFLYRVA